MTPGGKDEALCRLVDGDEVTVTWGKLDNGEHPLHVAAEAGNIYAVRSWVASGADVNVRGANNNTPLMAACYRCREDCIAELLKLGADARRFNKARWTPLHVLAWRCCVEEAVQLVVAAGCDPAMRNSEGQTAVELARSSTGDEWGDTFAGWVAAAVEAKKGGGAKKVEAEEAKKGDAGEATKVEGGDEAAKGDAA